MGIAPLPGTAINYIQTPAISGLPFTVFLYALAIASFIIMLVFFRKRAATAAVVAFALAGAVAAARMDLLWVRTLGAEASAFAGGDTREKLLAMGADTGYFDFAAFVRKSLPEGAAMRDTGDRGLEMRVVNNDPSLTDAEREAFSRARYLRYHLMPVLTTKDGRFAVFVEGDMDGAYDPSAMTLRLNGHLFRARPYATYVEGAAVYEIIEDLR